jgi:5-hydroxyisourate hydrolase
VSGRLTTHVLDTARGRPAQGVAVTVLRDGAPVALAVTGPDGRTPEPLLEGAAFTAGLYEITFSVGAWLAGEGFLDEVPVRFRVTAPEEHHHVPLLVSPWSYTTYRGS